MAESVPQFPVPPQKILEKLRASELRSLEPVIEDLSWLNDVHQIPNDDITRDVFRNNPLAAGFFFERASEMHIQIFQDPEDEQNAYVVTSQKNKLVTVLRTHKRNLSAQIDMPAQDLYVSDPTLKKALNISSLFPKNNQNVRFSMTAYPVSSERSEQRRSGFGFDHPTNTMCIDQIVDEESLTVCCHEIGHIWAIALEIDARTKEEASARRGAYKIDDDSWDTMKKGVSEVLFSERVANIIGKIMAEVILKSGAFSDSISSLFSRAWRDEQEARYDKRYLEPMITKYPQLAEKIRGYFASRLNRKKS